PAFTTKPMNPSKIVPSLFEYRFEVLAVLLTAIIFGGGIASTALFDEVVLPLIIFLAAGLSVIMVPHRKLSLRLIFSAFAGLALLMMILRLFTDFQIQVRIASLEIFILFFAILSYEVFRQMVNEKEITPHIIFAAFDCYLLLGMLGAMLFALLMVMDPNAFSNMDPEVNLFNKMIYFSFITLTSIGYGDIVPQSVLAEKFTAFYGLIGHFYSVVVVGIIVGKYVAVRGRGE
ncbi:MAG: potassium channel family protein, partial [Bacteroidota bacterium]